MATVLGIRSVGNSLLETYSDGSTRWFHPTGSGFYVPTRQSGGSGVTTGAGESGIGNGDTSGSNSAGSVSAPKDDYPWRNAPEDSLSPLRYSYRDCTDFVAWRINRDNGVTSSPWKYTWGNLRWQGPGGNGDAIGWRADWIRYGRKVDLPAAPGRIGWYNTGSYGHVCYIQAVASNGTVTIEEYNWQPYHQAYNKNLRTAAPGSTYYPDSFLEIPKS